MNVTVRFQRQPREAEKWLNRTASTTGREFDLKLPVESLMIPLDAYEQSALEIKYLPDTDEVCVIHHGLPGNEEPECIYSVKREEP